MNLEALILARKIALYNSEVIHYVKNSLKLITPIIQKTLDDNQEKLIIMTKDAFPKVEIGLIIANSNNNLNHDLTKLDIDLIYQMLVESVEMTDNNEFSN